jgi:hypothetical protein
MALTRTGARSAARCRATYSTAPLVTPLTSEPGPGRHPTTPENNTTDPFGRSTGAKCLATSIGPIAFAVNAATSLS